MKKIILTSFCSILITQSSFASSFFGGSNSTGIGSIVANVLFHKSSPRVPSTKLKLTPQKSQEECSDTLANLLNSQDKDKLKYFAYLQEPISKRDIQGNFHQELLSRKKGVTQPGLVPGTHVKLNSFQGKSAPHLLSGCKKHMKVTNVDIVKVTDFPKNLGQEKTCRRVTISLDQDKYSILYCIGENALYADYNDTSYSIVESVDKFSENN